MFPQSKGGRHIDNIQYASPQPKGGIDFWCGSLRPRSFDSVSYLLNHWMDFDQTCINTVLGGRKEWIRFKTEVD